MRPLRAVPATLACLAVLVGAGCSASSDGDPGPTSGATTSGSGSTSASASPSPSVTAFTTTCGESLALVEVNTAAGQPIIGRTAFVVGEADATIGRLAYLNCRYGLPAATAAATPGAAAGADPAPAVEIGVSLYDTAARATARVDGTVADYASSGSATASVRVGTSTGTVLTTPGQPTTLVVAAGARTVAVTMSTRVFTGNDQIAAIAALAVDKVV